MARYVSFSPEQREALREVVRCRLRLWDAGSAAEELLDCDVATAGESLDHLCVGVTHAEVDRLSDADLAKALLSGD